MRLGMPNPDNIYLCDRAKIYADTPVEEGMIMLFAQPGRVLNFLVLFRSIRWAIKVTLFQSPPRRTKRHL